MWDYQVSLLELIVRNIVRYPQSATSKPVRYQPYTLLITLVPVTTAKVAIWQMFFVTEKCGDSN
jgi:hypothetical protein